jgi:hypothetical protein
MSDQARPHNRRLKQALVALGVIVFAGALWFALAVAWIVGIFHPTPQIARGLSNTITVARREFDERVKAAFPVGSSEEEMLDALRRQGFKRQEANFGDLRGRVPYMGVSVPRTMCGVSYNVFWEAEQGRLTDVSGSYNVTCP